MVEAEATQVARADGPQSEQQYKTQMAELERINTLVRLPQFSLSAECIVLIIVQIANLRFAIPDMLAPLLRADVSPDQAFAELSKAALTTKANLESLREQWEAESMKELVQSSKQRVQKGEDTSVSPDLEELGW